MEGGEALEAYTRTLVKDVSEINAIPGLEYLKVEGRQRIKGTIGEE